ncbi:MAG: hypothetical protein ABIG84_07725 [archaeon]
MVLFDNKDKKEEAEKIAHQMDLMQHQIMDLKDQIKKVAEQQVVFDKSGKDVNQALNVLDGDITDAKDSFSRQLKALELRVIAVEKTVNDLRLLGRLAIENREAIDTIMNILKKIAEPEFREVIIANDSELDRFKRIENEIDELKDREIIVEGPGRRK